MSSLPKQLADAIAGRPEEAQISFTLGRGVISAHSNRQIESSAHFSVAINVMTTQRRCADGDCWEFVTIRIV